MMDNTLGYIPNCMFLLRGFYVNYTIFYYLFKLDLAWFRMIIFQVVFSISGGILLISFYLICFRLLNGNSIPTLDDRALAGLSSLHNLYENTSTSWNFSTFWKVSKLKHSVCFLLYSFSEVSLCIILENEQFLLETILHALKSIFWIVLSFVGDTSLFMHVFTGIMEMHVISTQF